MFRNYLKIAWRTITRNKVYSFINIAGLSIGLASVIFIFLYVDDELKFDRFFQKSDHLFQVNLNGRLDGVDFQTSNSPPTVGPAMKNYFPEIEAFARVYKPGNTVVRSADEPLNKYFTETKILAVDSNFLQVFDYSMAEGNSLTGLNNPNSMVITSTAAKKYFGNESPINKILLLDDDNRPFTITAVLNDIPAQSSLQFDFLVPISAYRVVKQFSWSWIWLQVNTFVKLKDKVDVSPANIARLNSRVPAMVKVQAASAFARVGTPMDEFLKKGQRWDFNLMPYTDVHLRSAAIGSRLTALSDIKYIYIFSVIALFIIVLACVNFMNLSTAQSAKRAKEVGIRKVLGSIRYHLVRQFISEAFLYSLISAVTSILLVIVMLKPFNQVSGKSFDLGLFLSGPLWLLIIALVIVTTLLAGSYPAFYLTSFKPAAVLKTAKSKAGTGNFFIRNGLVILQFAVSSVLIISTIVVYLQLQYARTKNLGLNKENVIIISNSNRLGNKEISFAEEIKKIPSVISSGISTSIPTKDNFGDGYEPQSSGDDVPSVKDLGLSSFMVDEGFVPTLNIKIKEGRNFSKEYSDSASVILNEAAVKRIGWKKPVGKFIIYPGNNNQKFEVIGVANDFSIASLRNQIDPFALFHSSSQTYGLSTSYTLVRIEPSKTDEVLNALNEKWKSFGTSTPFDYTFLDEEFESMYLSDKRMGNIFTMFTLLSVFVACLGLFGLSAFTAERRIKEIGIRKVLGASVPGIVTLLTREFLKPVLVASLISFPIAWYFMNKWLEDFAFRINLGAWIFIASAILAVFIAIVTVSFQAFKAASTNPVKSLRTE